MKKSYTLPAVTARSNTTISIGVSIDDDAKFREWLSLVRRSQTIRSFKFHYTGHPDDNEYHLVGRFCPEYTRNGIYVWINLDFELCFRNKGYPLDEFCRMVKCTARPSSLSLCVTVKV